MITLKRFRRIEAAVRAAGYGYTIEWSETVTAPKSARAFADEAIFVICSSGMKVTVAELIFERIWRALRDGMSASAVFGHPGKAAAIDMIWAQRKALFRAFRRSSDPIEFCASLPFIGPVTKDHLAKNLGVNVSKGDRHLQRLADAEDVTVEQLCARLARQTRYRAATIDTILWRACADQILDSQLYLERGWRAAFNGYEDSDEA